MEQLVLPPDYAQRTVDAVRLVLDDIPACAAAELKVVFHGQVPQLRIVFGPPTQFSRNMLKIGLLMESRQNPLGPGRLVPTAQLQRHVRVWVEDYLKIQGEGDLITKKVS